MPDTRALIEQIIVWTAPIILVAAVFACAAFIQAFRRSLGARRSTLGLTILFAAGVLVLHAGYLLGPLWLSTGRRGLGLALMAPGAIFFLFALAALLKVGALRSIFQSPQRAARRLSLGVLLIAAAYIAPVVVMFVGIAA